MEILNRLNRLKVKIMIEFIKVKTNIEFKSTK